MERKRLIDKIRDSSGSGEIGTSEDGGIESTMKIGERLLIIKERSIYEFIFADSIDPERTNVNLAPSIHKLIINQGQESEIVGKTLLTAKNLFQPQYYDNSIDHLRALTLSIDILSELAILVSEIENYFKQEKVCAEAYKLKREQKGSYAIPSIVHLDTQCKTIIQKADHIEQILMDIIIAFYPNDSLTKQSHFPTFHDVLKVKYGEDDPFAKFIGVTVPYMSAVRLIRNGLDHRLNTVTITNYELQKDSSVLSPTIELNHKDGKLKRTSLSEFFGLVLENTPHLIETTFAYLAGKNIKKNGFPYQVLEIPEDKRRNKFVKFAIWLPIGPEGFYQQ